MRIDVRFRWLSGLLSVLLLLAGLQVPCWSAEAGEGESEAAASEELIVPDGTPEELIAFIEEVITRQSEANDYAAFTRFRTQVAQAVLEASDKILAGKATEEQTNTAVQFKLNALSILFQTGDDDAKTKLLALPGELKKAGLMEFARNAKAVVLQIELQDTSAASSENFGKLINEIKAFLAAGPIGPQETRLTIRAAQKGDQTGNAQQAAAGYRDFGKLLAANDDELIAGVGKEMEGIARRMTLLGSKMQIQGVTLAGEPFDWSGYDGRVVLVSFWATWCGPCVQEIANIRRYYDLYHDRGFDVVAISVDEDHELLQAFVQQRELPWTVLFDADPETESMATHYGVSSFPTLFLVDAEGKVVSLDVRGPTLGYHLNELLGPVEEPEAADPGSDPKDPA